jgi:pimeloyl-ACP methyl ester carboxylesterase
MACSRWSLVFSAGALVTPSPALARLAVHAPEWQVGEARADRGINRSHVSRLSGQDMRDTLIDVGGYRLHFRIAAGQADRPVVVLDAGGGLDADEWRSLQPRLARVTGATVVSYDRAGFGSSDLPTTPFDFRREVEGLHAGLRALGFADRIILVGHSYGGFTLQLYAALFASSVRGLLFIDPNSPSFVLALGGAARVIGLPGQHLPFDTAGPLTKVQAATVHQMKSFGTTVDLVAAAPLPSTVPVIVLTAGVPWWPVPRQNRAFRASHELLANSVDDGALIVAQRSGHMIPESRPDLIVTSVQTLLEKHQRQ